MDKLQAMDVFVKVVDTGSFTRASDSMQLPKATVSTLIRNLEVVLGVKLLNRTTRRLSVTTDGAAYYERCQSILADVRDAEDALSRNHASPAGRLRIDVPTGLGRNVLIPALPAFLERYPDINVEIGCSDRPVDLIEEGVDCALRAGELADSSLIARRIGSMHFVTCATPGYIARYGRPEHPTDLMRHRCVNYFSAKTGRIFDWDFASRDERLQVRLPGRVAVNDSDAYLAATLSGMGIAQMPTFVLRPYLESGELEMVLTDWCVEAIPMHIVYPQNRHLSAKVRVFVEWAASLIAAREDLQLSPPLCLQMARDRLNAPARVPVLEAPAVQDTLDAA